MVPIIWRGRDQRSILFCHTQACRPTHTSMHTHIYTYTHIVRQSGRPTERQTDRQTGRQAGRQTDKQIGVTLVWYLVVLKIDVSVRRHEIYMKHTADIWISSGRIPRYHRGTMGEKRGMESQVSLSS